MRRLLAVAALATPALAPAATAQTPLPCDYWVHGCNVVAYVYDACDRVGADCGIV